jgi:hypothetical protein
MSYFTGRLEQSVSISKFGNVRIGHVQPLCQAKMATSASGTFDHDHLVRKQRLGSRSVHSVSVLGEASVFGKASVFGISFKVRPRRLQHSVSVSKCAQGGFSIRYQFQSAPKAASAFGIGFNRICSINISSISISPIVSVQLVSLQSYLFKASRVSQLDGAFQNSPRAPELRAAVTVAMATTAATAIAMMMAVTATTAAAAATTT